MRALPFRLPVHLACWLAALLFSNIGYAGSSDVLNQSLSAGWTHTASPTLVNELRFGYMRYRVNAVPNGVGTSPATAAGIPGLNLDSYFTSGMPAFFINGDQNGNGNSSLGYALNINSCNCPLAQREQQYQVVDNVSKMLGNHSLKFGADIRYALNLRVPSDAHRSGELTFGPSYTGLVTGTGVTQGYGLASFLLGETTSFRRYVSSSTDAQERSEPGVILRSGCLARQAEADADVRPSLGAGVPGNRERSG